MAESSSLVEPTCEFFGGPWDGRVHHYTILAVEFYVPNVTDPTVTMVTNLELTKKPRMSYHLYKRMWIRGTRDGRVFAKYLYQGLIE